MKQIKKVKLFVNDNELSKNVAKEVEGKLLKNDFIISDDFDLAIAIGGDGSFLRMIKSCNFDSKCYYIGINAGTLGFAQEINIESIDTFIEMIKKNDFKFEEIGVEEVIIECNDTVSRQYALNEVVVRDKYLNTTKLDIYIDDVLLESYAGDGILVSTSFGSTAYNLSFGGSIVYNTFHTLQITPIAPLNNKSYRNLINSVIIPANKEVKLIPLKDKENLIVTIDGDNNYYDNVLNVKTSITGKTINVIRNYDYNFVRKINDKFLK